jgi:hypothetical protein
VKPATEKIACMAAAIVGCLAGYAVSPYGSLDGQTPAAQTKQGPTYISPIPAPSLPQGVPLWPNTPKEASYWSIDDIQKAHRTLSDADKAGRKMDPNSTLHDFPYWTRTHSLFVNHKANGAAGAAEQHMGYAQFIVIMGGTGTFKVGGDLQKPVTLTEGSRQIAGELRGPAIAGGDTYQVAEGDWLSIPAGMASQVKANAGGLTYMTMKVNAMLYPWDLIR